MKSSSDETGGETRARAGGQHMVRCRPHSRRSLPACAGPGRSRRHGGCARPGARDRRPPVRHARARCRSTSGAASSSRHDDHRRHGRASSRAASPRAAAFSSWRSTAVLDRVGERSIVGDQDRLRGGVVLGLGQQVGGDPVRDRSSPSATTSDFRRPGDHVDADRAEHPALGRGDIGVARADDLVDRRDRLRPVGQRADRLRAADPPDLVTPARCAAASTSGLTRRPASARRSTSARPRRPWPEWRSSAPTRIGGACRRAHRGRRTSPPSIARPAGPRHRRCRTTRREFAAGGNPDPLGRQLEGSQQAGLTKQGAVDFLGADPHCFSGQGDAVEPGWYVPARRHRHGRAHRRGWRLPRSGRLPASRARGQQSGEGGLEACVARFSSSGIHCLPETIDPAADLVGRVS